MKLSLFIVLVSNLGDLGSEKVEAWRQTFASQNCVCIGSQVSYELYVYR